MPNDIPLDAIRCILTFLPVRSIIRLERVKQSIVYSAVKLIELCCCQTSKVFHELLQERSIWADVYRGSDLPLPPGPYDWQTTAILRSALVCSAKLDAKWPPRQIPESNPDYDLTLGRYTKIGPAPVATCTVNCPDAHSVNILGGRWVVTAKDYHVSCWDLDSDSSRTSLGWHPTEYTIFRAQEDYPGLEIRGVICTDTTGPDGRLLAFVVIAIGELTSLRGKLLIFKAAQTSTADSLRLNLVRSIPVARLMEAIVGPRVLVIHIMSFEGEGPVPAVNIVKDRVLAMDTETYELYTLALEERDDAPLTEGGNVAFALALSSTHCFVGRSLIHTNFHSNTQLQYTNLEAFEIPFPRSDSYPTRPIPNLTDATPEKSLLPSHRGICSATIHVSDAIWEWEHPHSHEFHLALRSVREIAMTGQMVAYCITHVVLSHTLLHEDLSAPSSLTCHVSEVFPRGMSLGETAHFYPCPGPLFMTDTRQNGRGVLCWDVDDPTLEKTVVNAFAFTLTLSRESTESGSNSPDEVYLQGAIGTRRLNIPMNNLDIVKHFDGTTGRLCVGTRDLGVAVFDFA
ncbi:hypothetical protein BJ138DRAFT_1112792 [Hygrophoropsis aurantiaca]|uniref:Uncharacterized protein n=1 Tax=Hygrophoropsis aurantiaca TaxID=72124 RepID=A0ACB8AH62_9AGAM|nr:hypothetical protein BJ138DRAFT_1112792 [Hygrophoropsis aurantiaca]